MALEVSEGDEDQPTDDVNSTVHKDGQFQGVGSSPLTLGASEGEEGDLLGMQNKEVNIITLDHDSTHNDNDLVHTGGKIQEGGSSQMTLETSEGVEVQSDGDLLDTTNSQLECVLQLTEGSISIDATQWTRMAEMCKSVRLKEMATNGELLTPAINVNECL